jgi:hypothetical protein
MAAVGRSGRRGLAASPVREVHPVRESFDHAWSVHGRGVSHQNIRLSGLLVRSHNVYRVATLARY